VGIHGSDALIEERGASALADRKARAVASQAQAHLTPNAAGSIVSWIWAGL
jgi:hypothetical protein